MDKVMLRTSERNLFKRCQWAWEREYIDRLKVKGRESIALWFGTGIHLAMEHWYIPGRERGTDPRKTWREYVQKAQADTKYVNTYHDGDFAEAVPSLELGLDMLEGYLEHYGKEPNIEVISAEQTFQVEIPYQEWHPLDGRKGAEAKDGKGKYVGTFDQVYRDHDTGKIWLKDFKTAAQLGASATQYLPLDDQAGSYWAVADYTLRKQGLIGKNERISGIVYDYLVKAKRDLRPRNAEGFVTNKPQKRHYVAALNEPGVDKLKLADLESLARERGVVVFGEVSANQPRKLLDRVPVYRNPSERRRQINRIQDDLEAMSLVRNGVLPATKTPTRECSFCQFREICEMDESGDDWSIMKERVFSTWNPYEAHEKKEG